MNKHEASPVTLFLEEYEAVRLCDYEMLNHLKAAEMMCVSRPTFTRIYASALRKIAKAMVEGTAMKIDGGKVCFDSDWFHCEKCKSYFTHPQKQVLLEVCPLCSSNSFQRCNDSEIFNSEDNIKK